MTKEDEILDFLNEHVFQPILDSDTSSVSLKRGVRSTLMRMRKLSAEKMLHFYWTAIVGTEKSIAFARMMTQEGFSRFEDADVLEEFRLRFSTKWLRS